MTDWVLVDKELPKQGVPVLCIIRSGCKCEHYSPCVLSRVPHEGDWVWYSGFDHEDINICVEKKEVIAWMHLPKFPAQFEEGFPR